MTLLPHKSLKHAIYRYFLQNSKSRWIEEELSRRLEKTLISTLGHFENGMCYSDLTISGLSSESGVIQGEIVHLLTTVCRPEYTLLLPGERRSARIAYSDITKIPIHRILTAGLHDDMDYSWNYESSPSNIPQVNIIVSQAMLEHLIDPYRHVCDCYDLLAPGGYMIFHSVMPCFQYHRYPVDCQRFYPDWFEEVASRLGAKVFSRIISSKSHIIYCFMKPNG